MNERRKIALFCNVRPEAVIQALDVASIYDVPLAYHREGLDEAGAGRLRHRPARRRPICRAGRRSPSASPTPEGEVTIAIVGKYTGLKDAYKSLNEALFHGGIANRVQGQARVDRERDLRARGPGALSRGRPRHPGARRLRRARLGGQDPRRHVRARAQGALFRHLLRHADGVIEAARDLVGIEEAGSTEFGPTRGAGRRPDDRVDARQRAGEAPPRRRSRRHHAARRLSGRARPRAAASPRSTAATQISERHRHRYEVNTHYRERLKEAGLRFCRHVARRPAARDHRVSPTIPGSSACSSTPS